MSNTVRVGLLGCGNIGTTFALTLQASADRLELLTGLRFELRRIVVRDPGKPRDPGLRPELFTDDAEAVVAADDIDVVVELMGGVEPAGDLLLTALGKAKPVVTANKELVAHRAPELYRTADEAGVDLLFEAAAVAAVPVVRTLRESLRAEPIQRLVGIINGTTNYILSAMSARGLEYATALREAQQLGYAEPNPYADVSNSDAGSKLAILASLAFGMDLAASDVSIEGIDGVDAEDLAIARRYGYEIKALAVAEAWPDGSASLDVYPALVKDSHPLAKVQGSFNAVAITGAWCGELMLYGAGAGREATTSALLGDLVDAAENRARGTHRRVPIHRHAQLRDPEDVESSFYLKLKVTDLPGTLATVSAALGRNGVSIRFVEQENSDTDTELVFFTHPTVRRAMTRARAELVDLPEVIELVRMLRVLSI
ncbi:MAG TPA: homoserine dehydrogenase [Jatrophihabitans sp.]|nr:homoserine dehydrogenase [Jatrophihabitans sp.]